MDAQPLDGYIVWIYGDPPDQRNEVRTAILRDGGQELAIDCDCPYPGVSSCVYTIILRRRDALLFHGSWKSAQKQESGSCSCRLYTNGQRIACLGTWEEEGAKQSWYAEFAPAEKKA